MAMPLESEYLVGGSNQLSEILAGLKMGSQEPFHQDSSLNKCIRTVRDSLFRDENLSRYLMLIDQDYPKMMVQLLEFCYMKGNSELLLEILGLLGTCTNDSEDFSLALMNINFHDVVIQHTLRYSTDPRMDPIYLQLTHSYLVIIFNIIKVDKFRIFFHENSEITLFKEAILHLIRIVDEDNQIISLLVISFLNKGMKMDEELLGKHTNIVDSIADYVCKAFIDENREFCGYNVWEMLLALQSLSMLGVMKFKIVENQSLIPVLITIISSDTSKVEEVEVVLQILSHLYDDPKIKSALNVIHDFDSVIRKLSQDHEGFIKIIADGILSKSPKNLSEIKDEEHIEYDACFSYSFEDRLIMEKVERSFQNRLNIYFSCSNKPPLNCVDFDYILSQSKVMVIGLSDSYQEDDRCIAEMIKAVKAKKPLIAMELLYKFKPVYWLARMINSCDSINFYDYDKFQSSIMILYQSIKSGSNQQQRTSQLDEPNDYYFIDWILEEVPLCLVRNRQSKLSKPYKGERMNLDKIKENDLMKFYENYKNLEESLK